MSQSTDNAARRRYDALVALMRKLAELHDELTTVLTQKLDSMRRADLESLHTQALREQAIIESITERDGLRRQLMGQIGKGLGMSVDIARVLPVRKLAERLARHHRQQLNAAADRLRNSVVAARRANEMVQSVSEQTLHHIREVFASLTQASEPPAGGYTSRGRTAAGPAKELFEAIG